MINKSDIEDAKIIEEIKSQTKDDDVVHIPLIEAEEVDNEKELHDLYVTQLRNQQLAAMRAQQQTMNNYCRQQQMAAQQNIFNKKKNKS